MFATDLKRMNTCGQKHKQTRGKTGAHGARTGVPMSRHSPESFGLSIFLLPPFSLNVFLDVCDILRVATHHTSSSADKHPGACVSHQHPRTSPRHPRTTDQPLRRRRGVFFCLPRLHTSQIALAEGTCLYLLYKRPLAEFISTT